MIELPRAEEAERALIGSVIMRPAVLAEVGPLVIAEDFFAPVNSEIWRAMTNLELRRVPVDLVTLENELRHTDRLRALEGGMTYVVACAGQGMAWNAPAYAKIIRDKAALRRVIAACAEIQSTAQTDLSRDADEFLRDAMGKISRVAVREGVADGESLAETFERIEQTLEKAERGEVTPRIPTTIEKLDEMLLGGLGVGHFITVISGTGIGKSSFTFQTVFRSARQHGVHWFLVSLEETRDEVFIKGAANLARIDTTLFSPRRPGVPIDPDENRKRWRTIHGAGMDLASLGNLVTIVEHRHISRIVAAATAWRSKIEGPAAIAINHTQKVVGLRGKGVSREEEVAGVAAALKNLAKDLKVPVLAPAQLNDEARREKRAPNLGDSRESRAIEHEADVVIALHRDRERQVGPCLFLIRKHRGGKVGRLTLQWNGPWQGFETATTEEEGYDG